MAPEAEFPENRPKTTVRTCRCHWLRLRSSPSYLGRNHRGLSNNNRRIAITDILVLIRLKRRSAMNTEMARLTLYSAIVLKGTLALLALLGLIRAKRAYRQLRGAQKMYFWIAATATATTIVWAASLAFLLTHPGIAPIVPQAGWYFLIFASPAAAIAAGSTMGIFVPSAKR